MIEEKDYEKLEKHFDLIYVRKEKCDSEMNDVKSKLSHDAVMFAKINTKLSAILWGLGALATAVIGFVVKLALGGG